LKQVLSKHAGVLVDELANFLSSQVGAPENSPSQVSEGWKSLLDELQQQLRKDDLVQVIRTVSELVRRSGAPLWADKLCSEPAGEAQDVWTPADWEQSWWWRQIESYLRSIGKHAEVKHLAKKRQQVSHDLKRAISEEVRLRTTLKLYERLDAPTRSDLAMVVTLLSGMSTGTGKQAAYLRQDAQKAMERCYSAVPCWIMPSWRVSEMLPSDLYSFDLVIIDEASQSDIRELSITWWLGMLRHSKAKSET
jgi:hypothetical protein